MKNIRHILSIFARIPNFNVLLFIILVNTRTLPHPRHNNHIIDPRSRDDQMIGKGYMPSPSPAPPLDGSYYNMNSDRYLSYPPMVVSIFIHLKYGRDNNKIVPFVIIN